MSSLRELVDADISLEHAMSVGTEMHLRLQRINIDAPHTDDVELADKIKSVPGLADFFRAPARAEVPVAYMQNGNCLSRRIDRMIIDDVSKTIRILDYKTDTERVSRHDKYVAQLREYIAIMRKIYPDYQISAQILWTHDWTLEGI